MKIPMKVDYGVRALVELAQRYGEGPIQSAVIARQQGIPEAYLDQLMTSLNKFGFVQSRRGPQGGHALAMDPKDIDLNMVMERDRLVGMLSRRDVIRAIRQQRAEADMTCSV